MNEWNILTIGITVFMFYRNCQVHKYCMKLTDAIYKRNIELIDISLKEYERNKVNQEGADNYLKLFFSPWIDLDHRFKEDMKRINSDRLKIVK